jgi:hypothetical protein
VRTKADSAADDRFMGSRANPSGRASFDFSRKTKFVVADQADLPRPALPAKIF